MWIFYDVGSMAFVIYLIVFYITRIHGILKSIGGWKWTFGQVIAVTAWTPVTFECLQVAFRKCHVLLPIVELTETLELTVAYRWKSG